jgi:hypothetical protein
MTRPKSNEKLNYLTAKDLPNFLGFEIWVQKKPSMISRGREITVFGKSFLELILVDVDFKRSHLVLQGHEGPVEVLPLSQCAIIMASDRRAELNHRSASQDEESLARGQVGLDN